MKKIDACKLRRKGGFTLVELIVVLVLLSVLSAVAVPTYLGYVDDNKAKQCERNRQALASYLDEMLVTNSSAGMSDVIAAHPEIKCPSGGEYKVLEDSVNNTVYCTCEGHGGTEGAVTVIAKKSSQVTAQSSTEREKETEKKPITVSIASCTVDVGGTCTMVPVVTPNIACTYSWSGPSNAVATFDPSSKTVTGVSEGTATITCTATPTDGSMLPGTDTATVTVDYPQIMLSAKDIALKVNEDKDAEVTLSPSKNIGNVSLKYDSYDKNLISIDNGRVKGLRAGETTVWVKVLRDEKEIGVQGSFKVTVTSDKVEPTGIILKLQNGLPNMEKGAQAKITLSPDMSGDIVVCPSPEDASLEGYSIVKGWVNDGNSSLSSSLGNWIVTANNAGDTTVNVQVQNGAGGGIFHAYTILHIRDSQTETEASKQPTGINVTPKEYNLIQGHEITVTIAPDTSGDIVISAIEGESLEGYEFSSSYSQHDLVTISGNKTKKLTIKAGDTGIAQATVSLWIGREWPYPGLGQDIKINVIIDPDKTGKFNLGSTEFTTSTWSSLKNYLRQKAQNSQEDVLLQKNVFMCYDNGWHYYIIKQDASIEWKEEYDNITFEDFMKSWEIKSQFVEIYPDQFAELNTKDYQNFNEGCSTRIGDVFYVSTRQCTEDVTGWTDQTLLEKGFIPILQ